MLGGNGNAGEWRGVAGFIACRLGGNAELSRDNLLARRPRIAQRPAAIVIGVDCLQGLQTARVLAGRGLPVIGVAKDARHYACRTRACDEVLIADTGGDGLIDLLSEIGPTFEARPVLFPCQDKNVIVVSRHRQTLADWYRFILPAPDVVEMMMNKATFYAYAHTNGFPLTPTYCLHNRDDAERVSALLAYPAVLKPAVRLREWSRHTKEKAVVVADAGKLLQQYERLSPWTDVLIAQELIEGPDTNHFTCNLYFGQQGELLVSFTTRKLRQWPVATGQACLSEEVKNDVIVNEAVRLFQSVDYRGLAYLEMKVDERSGEYYIVEPNIGRPTGRSASAEAAGVDLLYTMYCDAVGLPLPKTRTQNYSGLKWINIAPDFRSALFRFRRHELTLREWWRSVRGPRVYAILSWKDPLPFLAAVSRAIPEMRSTRRRN